MDDKDKRDLIQSIKADIMQIESTRYPSGVKVYREDVMDVLDKYLGKRDPYATKINESLGILGQ